MSVFYLDTSALLKRYVTETGSGWLRRVLSLNRGVVVVFTQLAIVEGLAVDNPNHHP